MTAKRRRKIKKVFWRVILGGILTIIFAGMQFFISMNDVEDLRASTMNTLKQQCKSFENIQAVDRMSSLFKMCNSLVDLSYNFMYHPEFVMDEYLESYVESMRWSGIAVLDGKLQLEASGYTRFYENNNWKDNYYPGCFESMMLYPNKVYMDRITVDGNVYDVCAVSRKEKRGIIVAYYGHPSGLLEDNETDLINLLEGITMDLDGDFLIEHNGKLLSKDKDINDFQVLISDSNDILESSHLSPIYHNNRHYLAAQTLSGEYSLYVYFPMLSVFRDAALNVVIFVLLYCSFWLILSAIKNRSLREKQKQLEETNKQLGESMNILQSLQNLYFTIFYVDIKKNQYETLFAAPWISSIVPFRGEFNKQLGRLISVSVDKDYQQELKELLSFDNIKNILKTRNMTESKQSFYIDYLVNRNNTDGKKIWCRVTVTIVDVGNDMAPAHVLVMLQDVNTEKAKEAAYQEEILQKAAEARAANHAKSTFLFNMSHDMRTPMNAILGYSNLALQNLDDKDKLVHYMDNIKISGERMLSLVNDVLELARIENDRIVIDNQICPAGEVIRDSLVIIEPLAKEKKQTITLNKNIIYPYLCIDKPHLSQITLNILSNAVKFTPEGGHIECTVTHLKGKTDDECVTEVIISDNGIGMSKDFVPHIFEMFERERSSTVSGITGTGLGMGIVKKFVDIMGGTIEVESELGKGSTFIVRIPCKIADKKDYKAMQVEYHTDKTSSVGKRILLAEDNDLNAEIAMEIIGDEGFEVDRAENGEVCVKMLEEVPNGYYGLILMDIQMPVMDGYAATKVIREMSNQVKANIPIVAMTANAFPEDKQRALSEGMNDHIAKPIDMKVLMGVFEKYLGADLIAFDEENA